MPDLGPSAVHVWHATLQLSSAQLRRLETFLSDDERRRASRVVSVPHRHAFIAARGVLRELLAGYLELDPSHVRFCYGARGKPTVDPALGSDLTFNLSHSHGLALFVVGRRRRLGIDVERIRQDRNWDGIARRFFSRNEAAALLCVAPPQRARAFYACWTRKEAFVKATGEGIRQPLSSFEVSVAADEPATLVHIDGDRERALEWRLQDLQPDPDYAAALVVEGHGGLLSWHQWPRAT